MPPSVSHVIVADGAVKREQFEVRKRVAGELGDTSGAVDRVHAPRLVDLVLTPRTLEGGWRALVPSNGPLDRRGLGLRDRQPEVFEVVVGPEGCNQPVCEPLETSENGVS